MELENILCELKRSVEELITAHYCLENKIVPHFEYSFRRHVMYLYFGNPDLFYKHADE